METMAKFFDSINRMLGVSTPGELIFHPVFITVCVIAFIYFVLTRMKYFAIAIGGLVGGAVVVHYLYPSSTSNLTEPDQILRCHGRSGTPLGLHRFRSGLAHQSEARDGTGPWATDVPTANGLGGTRLIMCRPSG